MRWTVRGSRPLGAGVVTTLAASLLLVTGGSAPAPAAPAAADFDGRRTVHTYASVGTATHQVVVATGSSGLTAVAFLDGWRGYVSLRQPGSETWGPARAVTTRNVFAPDLAVGADGTVAVSWQGTGGGLQVTTLPADGVWEARDLAGGGEHQVGVSAAGVVTVVQSAYVYAAGGGHYRLRSWRRPAGRQRGFAGPALVSPAGAHARTPDLVIDRQGRPVTVWTHEVGSAGTQIRLARGASGSNAWAASEQVAAAGAGWRSVQTPAVTAAADGAVTVVHSRRHATEDDTYRVDARTRAVTGAWGAVSVLRAPAAFRPVTIRTVTTGGGATVAAWTDKPPSNGTTYVRARHRDVGAAAWDGGAAVDVGSTFELYGEAHTVALAAGPGTTAAVTWDREVSGQPGGEIRVRQLEGGAWNGQYVLSEPAGATWHAWRPALAVSPRGQQTVVWGRQYLPDGNAGRPEVAARSTAVPPPVVRSAARVRGTPRVGSVLRCAAAFADARTTRYTWRSGTRTIGRSQALRPAPGHLRRRLVCAAVGTNASGSAATTSRASAVVRPGFAPRARNRPAIRGTRAVGRRLTVTRTRWTPAPSRLAYRWLRAGKPIRGRAGAGRVYLVRPADRGRRLQVVVTALRTGHARGTTRSGWVRIR